METRISRVKRSREKARGWMGAVGIFRIFRRKPRIRGDLCRKCGVCVESCPVEGKALHFSKGRISRRYMIIKGASAVSAARKCALTERFM